MAGDIFMQPVWWQTGPSLVTLQLERHVMILQRPALLHPDPTGLTRAAEILAQGGLVSFPTETVYGLGADARADQAVAGIFAAKGRPSFNPLIVHLRDFAAAAAICEFNDDARRLAAAFWPGALTLVLPLRAEAGISRLVTAGLDSVAVRVPDHPVAAGLLAAFGGPVAAPSANPSGRISPTTAAHVRDGLGDRIDAILDGGACAVGVESTILSCLGDPVLLRAGGLPVEAIETCLGRPLAQAENPDAPLSPGQLLSHYAPQGQMRLQASAAAPGEVMLGFGPMQADLNLSPKADLTEAAARLFDCLHQLDAMGATRIAVAPIPDHGLGRAINDRLKRAAAPR
jgi:L-threonylcarbamoyladenylate synthase